MYNELKCKTALNEIIDVSSVTSKTAILKEYYYVETRWNSSIKRIYLSCTVTQFRVLSCLKEREMLDLYSPSVLLPSLIFSITVQYSLPVCKFPNRLCAVYMSQRPLLSKPSEFVSQSPTVRCHTYDVQKTSLNRG